MNTSGTIPGIGHASTSFQGVATKHDPGQILNWDLRIGLLEACWIPAL